MQWFSNLRLVKKITILSAIFTVFLIGIGLLALNALSHGNENFKSLNNDRLIPMYDLEEAKFQLISIEKELAEHLNASDIKVKELEEDIKNCQSKITELIDKYSLTYLEKEEEEGLAVLNDSLVKYYDSVKNVINIMNSNDVNKAKELIQNDTTAKYNNTIDAFNTLLNVQVEVAEELYTENESSYHKMIIIFIVILLVCIAQGAFITFRVAGAVSKPVITVTNKLKEISDNGGDLTKRIGINTRDEVGQLSQAFDSFMDKLQSMIKDVMSSAEVIASSSQQLTSATSENNIAMEQISVTVNGVANNTSENMAVVQQTTASLTEAALFSETTANASRKTSENSLKVKEAAGKSANQVADIVNAIDSIANSSKEVEAIIHDLGESSEKISEIVELITRISEQTNLLSLNAAIEAARAGESGKGFKVVADAIRKLADSTNKSAEAITLLVNDNHLKVERTVKSVEEVNEAVALGARRAAKVKTNMDKIIDNITEVVDQISDIDKAVAKQANITEEIAKGMNNIADNASDMTASTEEVSASVEEQVSTLEEIEATAYQLSQMAEQLNRLASGFKV